MPSSVKRSIEAKDNSKVKKTKVERAEEEKEEEGGARITGMSKV